MAEDVDASVQGQNKELQQTELKSFLEGHVALPGTQLAQREDGFLVVSTPEINQDSTIFEFEDNQDLNQFYEKCKALGELKLSFSIPKIENAKLTNFGIKNFNLQTPADRELYGFITQLGNQIAKNTSIGGQSQ